MKSLGVLGLALFGLIAFSDTSFAVEVDDVARSITESSERIPGLVAAISYLLAVVLMIGGIFKLKDHVENPSQNPLRNAIIRFFIAGSLIALPIIYEAMITTINGGTLTQFNPRNGVVGTFLTLLAGTANLPILNLLTMDFNSVMNAILDSISEVPGMISALAYAIGLVLGVSGLLKLKDHVENPEQNPLREGVIRLVIGGALFGLTTIYQAMAESMPGAGIGGVLSSLFGIISFSVSGYTGQSMTICDPTSGYMTGASIGDSLCSVIAHTGAFPAFLTAIAYLIGLCFGFWGIFKIKAHVINPSQTSLSEGVTRLLAGGAFFALPIIVEVARNTMSPAALTAVSLSPVTRFREGGGSCGTGTGGGGLDCAMISMMNDLLGPMHVVLNFFAFCAGMVFIMIGISRLIKSAQEGARGPGGMGTIATFIAGGALISYNELIRAMTQTLSMGQFGLLPRTRTYITMQYVNTPELAQAHVVMSAILKFMIIVGLISFVRGIFIIRGVAEGNSQSSLMAGATHVVGGALAVNLGPLIMAVQSTLGITGYVTFT
jgi:hypothetical protein